MSSVERNRMARTACAMIATCGLVVGVAGLLGVPATAMASSHREAPGITEMPKTDATDFYMFNSYEADRRGYVTILANYQPFQTPYGGPNFFTMDPDAYYQIHIDNDGDAREDITFTFRFTNTTPDIKLNIGGQMVSVPLANIGPISAGMVGNSNVIETYTVDVTFGDRQTGRTIRLRNRATNSETFTKPTDRIGDKTFADYEAYANAHIFQANLPGARSPARVFVGQRKDPFVVNLGEIFDLVNLNPVGGENSKSDTLKEANVTTIALEVPSQWLRQGRSRIVGGWTTASLPRRKVFREAPTFSMPTLDTGPLVQVSRLAMPLVNEVVVGITDKDRFNASEPKDDGQFLTYVTNPTFPALLQALFPSAFVAPCLPRNDLMQAFLTGIPGVNQPSGVTASEMMRLNTDTEPKPKGMQSRLGALGGDLSGFPNGRRPGDDVVDIELRVVAGALIPQAGQSGMCAPTGTLALTDGAFVDDSFFNDVFPYLKAPVAASPNTEPVGP